MFIELAVPHEVMGNPVEMQSLNCSHGAVHDASQGCASRDMPLEE